MDNDSRLARAACRAFAERRTAPSGWERTALEYFDTTMNAWPGSATRGGARHAVRSLYVDADGWLWVGAEGRDSRESILVDGTPTQGLLATSRSSANRITFDETIHQILEDDAVRLWMNTNRGIFWVNAVGSDRLRRRTRADD